MVGSDVLVFTLGNAPMDFVLAFHNKNNPAGAPKSYRIVPEFTFPLANGTLFIFKAVDDLIFLHGAELRAQHKGDVHACRVALVFRWLRSERDFLVATNTMKPCPEVQERKATHDENRKRQRVNERKAALRGPFS